MARLAGHFNPRFREGRPLAAFRLVKGRVPRPYSSASIALRRDW
jgi:hypothetical protein